jgi:uronate dehydrogenase
MNSPQKPFGRLLLTGAAGGLGHVLRPHLVDWAQHVRISDLRSCGPAQAGEEVVLADLADANAVQALVEGVDAILQFGGVSLEAPFAELAPANITGLFNVYEAARRHGVRRIVYASSSHVVGFYRQSQTIGIDAPLRPDGLYAVTKCFGEALSRYYFDRFGLETVCLRIGSSFPEPKNARMMVSYLSYGDLVELVRCALFTARVDYSIVYGMSDNPVRWWDNADAAHLGFHARDSSRVFADRFPAPGPQPASQPEHVYQGGPWVLSSPMDP